MSRYLNKKNRQEAGHERNDDFDERETDNNNDNCNTKDTKMKCNNER